MFKRVNSQLTKQLAQVVIINKYKMFSHAFHKLCLVMVLCFLGSQSTFAQIPSSTQVSTDTTKYIVVKHDGIEYVGLLLSDDGRELLIETKSLGKIYIPKSEIKSIKPVDYSEDIAQGVVTSAGVFTTRYQFTTNCFPIKKDENYAMINLFGPEVHFAVHKDFSIGVMSTWISSPLVLALKYTRGTANPKINYGVGTLIGTSGYLNQARGYGALHWGMITYGDRRNNATLSVGYGYMNEGSNYSSQETVFEPGTYDYDTWVWQMAPIQGYENVSYTFKAKAPIIGLAGQVKVGKRASLIYDCMYIMAKTTNKSAGQDINVSWETNQVTVGEWTKTPSVAQNLLVVMPGMRFQKNENRAFQISLAGIIIPNEISFPIPMASWFFRF